MEDEARRVQDNLNTFSTSISASGIDHRVVMITDPDFVSVPPPLGTDSTRYRFVSRRVGSDEPFERVLGEYLRYADFLRPHALTHIVVVSDDNSAMRRDDFTERMEDLLGHNFTLHAIVSPGDAFLPCFSALGFAAAPGSEYWSLASETGGIRLSICSEDWRVVFDTLGEAVLISASLPCTYHIPEAPEGEVFDPLRVNVVYVPDDGADRTLPYVDDPSRCGGTDGWYYDDPSGPTEILLCPAACEALSTTATGGTLDIEFGCATILI
jgi:hypothetical protein